MKNISILGSTGSIGSQTLEIASIHPEKYRIIGLSASKNIGKLSEQIVKHKPLFVSVSDKEHASRLKELTGDTDVEILWGDTGYERLATDSSVDLVVSSMVGASGLKPTFSAIRSGKDVALANKESLVIAGEILMREAGNRGCTILPVDSEHSAIFQLLRSDNTGYVKRLVITASGGPFRNTPVDKLDGVTVEDALSHPTWKMGRKISIDSATLMNKGFEIIEAKWLFDIPVENISVWIHPQSIVHSMVEYIDGSFISQLSIPDMKIPIAYALSYPERIELDREEVNPSDFTGLTFHEVDNRKFRSVELAKEAIKCGGTMPAVMNASNESAVYAFLNERIKFTDIMCIVEKTMQNHDISPVSSLDDIKEADIWAREFAEKIIHDTGDK